MTRLLDETLELAVKIFEAGDVDGAQRLCRNILRKSPAMAGALHLLGVIAESANDGEGAIAFFDRSLAADVGDATVHLNRALVLFRLGRTGEALEGFDRAVQMRSDFAVAHANRGLTQIRLGMTEEALASFKNVLRLSPDDPGAHYNIANALVHLGRDREAVECYGEAIRLHPAFADAFCNRGAALGRLGEYEAALASIDKALRIEPGNAHVLNNRGSTLSALGDQAAAVQAYRSAIDIDPGYAEAHNNLGLALLAMARLAAAEQSFLRALEIDPEHIEAHCNLPVCLLQMGDLSRGWKEYEWCWLNGGRGIKRKFAVPEWTPGHRDARVLVWGEQGLGDQIFYLCMLRELAALATGTLLAVEPRLVPLIRRSFPDSGIISLDDIAVAGEFDAHIPVGSLGQYFRPRWEDIARNSAPYIQADGARSASLRARLRRPGRLVCGLAWRSTSDRFATVKSIPLRELEPLLSIAGIDFVDLQFGDVAAERAAFEAQTGVTLVKAEDIDNTRDIDAVAALIDACDLVVCVSNTVAHLAASMGKETLVMLPHTASVAWYWHHGHEDSPWYPSARLIRQTEPGDWSSVILRVKQELEARCS